MAELDPKILRFYGIPNDPATVALVAHVIAANLIDISELDDGQLHSQVRHAWGELSAQPEVAVMIAQNNGLAVPSWTARQ